MAAQSWTAGAQRGLCGRSQSFLLTRAVWCAWPMQMETLKGRIHTICAALHTEEFVWQVTTSAPTVSNIVAGSRTDDDLRQEWQAPLAGYKRERKLQAQRTRHLEAVERALQRRASSSALAQHFVRGA